MFEDASGRKKVLVSGWKKMVARMLEGAYGGIGSRQEHKKNSRNSRTQRTKTLALINFTKVFFFINKRFSYKRGRGGVYIEFPKPSN